MSIYEVAEVVASLRADAGQFIKSLNDAIALMKQFSSVGEQSADATSRAYLDEAAKIAAAIQKQAELEIKAANQKAELAYRSGQETADTYKKFVDIQLDYTKLLNNEQMTMARTAADIRKAQMQAETREFQAQLHIRENALRASVVASGGNWRQNLRDRETYSNTKILTNPAGVYSTAEQETASQKLIALAKEEQLANEKLTPQIEKDAAAKVKATEDEVARRKAAVANLARFEYEQGNLSAEAYKVFLERRLAADTEYGADYKATQVQLMAVEKDQLTEIQAYNDKVSKGIDESWKQSAKNRIEYEKMVADASKEAAASSSFVISKQFADRDKVQAGKQAGSSLVGSTFTGLGNVAAGITAVSAASALMSNQFEHDMVSIGDNTTMTTGDIEKMKSTVLSLGDNVGGNFDDIAKGYMHISNFGNDAADTTKELTLATKEAVATGANAEDIANALATSLNIWGAGAKNAAGYMDVLHDAAAQGNLTVQDFSSSAGPALAIAAEMKDPFYDAAGAISELSKQGFNASEAVTQVKSVISHISDPTNEATKHLVALQEAFKLRNPNSNIDLLKDFTQEGIQAKHLLGIFQDLATVTGGNATLIFPELSALRGGIGGVSEIQNLPALQKEIAELRARQLENTGSSVNTIFNRANAEDPTLQFSRLSNQLKTEFIPIGIEATKIFIAMAPAIEGVANVILDLMKQFQGLPKIWQEVVIGLGAAVLIDQFTGLFSILTKIPVALTTVTKLFSGINEAVALAAGGAGTFGEALGATVLAGTGPVALAIVGILALGAAIWGISKAFSDAKQKQDDFYNSTHTGNALTDLNNSLSQRQTELASDQSTYRFRTMPDNVKNRDAQDQYFITELSQIKANMGTGNTSVLDTRITDITGKIAAYQADLTKMQAQYSTPAGQRNNELQGNMQKVQDRLAQLNSTLSTYNELKQLDLRSAPTYTGSDSSSSIAQTIVETGEKMGATKAQILSAIETGIVESNLKNLPNLGKHNDHDSVGVFQQRAGETDKWGSVADMMDPAKSAASYYRHLIPGWDSSKTPGENAQKVQVSAFPKRYDQHQLDAEALLNKYYTGSDTSNTSGGVNPVTPDYLDKFNANQKIALTDAKELAKQKKEALTQYNDEIVKLEKILALKVKAQPFDSSNYLDSAMFDLHHKLGPVNTPAHAKVLEGVANQLDAASHAKYAENITDKASSALDKAQDPTPTWLKNLMSNIPGITQDMWKQLGTVGKKLADGLTEAQEKLKVFSESIEVANANTIAHAALVKAQYDDRLSLPENKALKTAVGDAGGVDKWMQMGDGSSPAQKVFLQGAQQQLNTEDEKFLRDLKAAHEKAISDFNKKYNPSLYDAGQEAVDEYHKTNPISGGGQVEDQIRANANQTEAQSSYDPIMSEIQKVKEGTEGLKFALSDMYNPAQKAVDEWANTNSVAIASIRKNLGDAADTAISSTEDMIRAYTVAQQKSDLQLSTQTMTDKLSGEQNMNRLYSSSGDQAVAAWENSPEGKSFINSLGADSQAILDHEAAIKKVTNAEAALAVAEQARQTLLSGSVEAIMGGLQAGLFGNPQATGQLQTQKYDEQSQLMQYQMQQLQWKQSYPNDANDPYTQRIQQIQQQIQKTQDQLNQMGNSFGAVFTRIFDSIYQTFVKTLQKIAMAYIQSQLMQLLQKGLSGLGSSSGGGGFWGAVSSGIGAVLGIAGGSAKSGGTSGGSTPPFMGIPTAANGWEVPGMEGLGDVYPAMLKPKEVVLPVPLAKGLKGMIAANGASGIGGGMNVTNNTVNQYITTPDIRGFRSSAATQRQQALKLIRP
jgi:TP901 family phage tail tape measure protein